MLNNYFVGISNLPMFNKDYNKLYRKKHSENVINDSIIEFINMPIEILKDLAIKQLKDVFNIELLTKEEALNLYDIDYQHVMLITGVHIVDDKIIRCKIEDSYGDKVHKDGYYILNDNFFDDFVIQVIIDKKYLSKDQLKLFGQEPILIDFDDPF